MHTVLSRHVAAALASVAITVTLFSAVVSEAAPPVAGSLFAQADAVIVR